MQLSRPWLKVAATVVICCWYIVSGSSTEEKNLTEGVSEFNILLGVHHKHIQVVRDVLHEIDIEAQKHSIIKCFSASGEIGQFRVNVRHALNAAEQLFERSKDLLEEWKDVPYLIDQVVDSGKLELALPIFDTSRELLDHRNTFLTKVMEFTETFQHAEWIDDRNYVDGRSEVLSKIFAFATLLSLLLSLILGEMRGVVLMCFLTWIVFLNWEILSPGKCAPALQSKIRKLLEILETRKSNFELASDTLDGLHRALRLSLDVKGNIRALSKELALQAEFIDPEHAGKSYDLLQRAQTEVTNQVRNIRRINKEGIYQNILGHLMVLQKTYPLLIQNVTVFLMHGHDQVDLMISNLPRIQNFMEAFRFDLAQSFLSQMLDGMLDVKQMANAHKDNINALVAKFIIVRGDVDEEVINRQQDADSANVQKNIGYSGGVVLAGGATGVCIATGGIACAVGAAGTLASLTFGNYHSGQEEEFHSHIRNFEGMSVYLKRLDQFLHAKASKMNDIYGQTGTAVTRMKGLENSIKVIKESKVSFSAIMTNPDKQFLEHSVRLSLVTLKKIKTLISELKDDINKRYLD